VTTGDTTHAGAERPYAPHDFPHLHDLDGLSKDQLDEHLGLYHGYVKALNELETELADLARAGRRGGHAWHALARRLPYEWNGMRMHELYFEALRPGGSDPAQAPGVSEALGEAFGGLDEWREAFVALTTVRGIGWVVLGEDRRTGRLVNVYVTLHEDGQIVDTRPILVLDMWEHAYLIDYRSAEKKRYVDAVLRNVDWAVCADRLAATPTLH